MESLEGMIKVVDEIFKPISNVNTEEYYLLILFESFIGVFVDCSKEYHVGVLEHFLKKYTHNVFHLADPSILDGLVAMITSNIEKDKRAKLLLLITKTDRLDIIVRTFEILCG